MLMRSRYRFDPAAKPKTRMIEIVLIDRGCCGAFAPRVRANLVRAVCAAAVLVALLLACAACGKKAKPKIAMAPRVGSTESGIASWYGYPYHGRRAANGEIYDMEQLTAAHRTLPFETWVEVENLSNGKHVSVRITDRGPFIEGRIIDLSRAAAREIGLLGPGITDVRIRVVDPPRDYVRPAILASAPPPAPTRPAPAEQVPTTPSVQVPPPAPNSPPPAPIVSSTEFAIQIGAYRDKDRAERIRKEYETLFGSARLVLRTGSPDLWRVLVGSESTLDGANALLAKILERTHPAFVVRVDEPAAALVQ